MTWWDFVAEWQRPYPDPEMAPELPHRAPEIVGGLIDRGLTRAQMRDAVKAAAAVPQRSVWAAWNAFDKRARELVRESAA